MRTSEVTTEFWPAFIKAQAEMPPVIFDSENPHFKNRYASLKAQLASSVPSLNANGIGLAQPVEATETGNMIVVTRLTHASGQWVEGTYPVAFDKPQQMGSAITYARRYSLSSILGTAAEDDDDGNAAQKGAATNPRTNGSAEKSNGNARYDRFKKACEANSVPLMEAVKKSEDQYAAKPSELTDEAFESLITWIEGAGELNEIINQEDAA